MSEVEFKAGDTVMLKSGGPEMTVDTVGSYDAQIKARCVWFEKNKLEYGVFPFAVLESS